MTLAAGQWHQHSLRLAARLVADADLLSRTFAGTGRPGRVVEVATTTGDRHRGGQSVAVVRWDTGGSVVYKPRSLRVDAGFAGLLRWLNEAGLRHRLTAPVVVDRGSYGWMAHVSPESCQDPDGVGRFYRRQGALLAVLTLLQGNDMHAENLFAVGEHPVVVDLETLLQPAPPTDDPRLSAAERRAHEAARQSVLQVGLLPALGWRTADGAGTDLSGLGSRPGQTTAMALPVLADAGTDRMRVRRERIRLDTAAHRPDGATGNLLDYADDLVEGFTEVHRLVRDRRGELLADDGPLAAFRGAPVRVLLRPTLTYGAVLRTSFHPDLLGDGLERERHLDHLWREVPYRPELAGCVPAERRDLWRGDIPYFTATADDGRLRDSDGDPVPGALWEPGLVRARQAVASWDAEHLAGQERLLRGTLATAAMNASEQLPPPTYRLPADAAPATDGELLAAADAVGHRLAELAIRAGGSAQWLGLSSQGGRHWTVEPLAADLFNGLAGVALFLAQLAELTGDRAHRNLALDTLATVDRQQARAEPVPPGGMAGLPGIAYAWCRLARLLDDESLIDRAVKAVDPLAVTAEQDEHYDVVAGSAGTIGSLRLLHRERPDGPALPVIAAAARCLAAAGQQADRAAWLSASLREQGWATELPAGFGHGAAGIAWALAEAARLLGEPSYAELAGSALDYQRGLFDPVTGTWRDVRSTVDDSYRTCAWCHGAVGIGLAALALATPATPGTPGTGDDDLDAAVAATCRDGFGISHSLCHGDVGSLELLDRAGSCPRRASLRRQARRHAGALLASIRTDGWQCGVPFGTETPSLMVGLAGIGYGLLRLAAPDRVPSVLTLEAHPHADYPDAVGGDHA